MCRNTLLLLMAASMLFAACKKEKKPEIQPMYVEKSATVGYWQLMNQGMTNGPAGMNYEDVIQLKEDNSYGVYREKVLIDFGAYTLTNEEHMTVLRFTSRTNEKFGLTINQGGMTWAPNLYGAFIYVLHKKNGL